MKKQILMAITGLVLLAGCNQDKVQQLSDENLALRSEQRELDSLLGNYVSTLNEIEANLAEIKKKENRISMTDNLEYEERGSDAIVADIRVINELMDESREKIKTLTAQLEAADGKLANLGTMVASLRNRIKEREKEIAEMTEELKSLNDENKSLLTSVDKLNHAVDTLSEANLVKTDIIEDQKAKLEGRLDELNTAYVATGTFKELKDYEVVKREGGIFGIGRVEVLRDDFNPANFNKINISEIHEIPLNGKRASLITTHPSGSYEISKDGQSDMEKLIIKDPDKFWESSKYLVVVLD